MVKIDESFLVSFGALELLETSSVLLFSFSPKESFATDGEFFSGLGLPDFLETVSVLLSSLSLGDTLGVLLSCPALSVLLSSLSSQESLAAHGVLLGSLSL